MSSGAPDLARVKRTSSPYTEADSDSNSRGATSSRNRKRAKVAYMVHSCTN